MASISSDEDHKPLMFLGKDVSKIPCFRNSFLYGIVGGFTMGIGCFLCTSRTLRSTHFGFGSFVTISSVYCAGDCRNFTTLPSRKSLVYPFAIHRMAYLIACRYNYDNTEERLNELKGIIKAKKSGTDVK